MTTLPAVVTISDLPTGSSVSGTELFEAVQTSGGVGNSVKLTLSQMMATAVGALPSGGGTGQVLQSLGTGFAASWVNISANVLASTGLAESGSTTVALSLASTAGLSVLGVAATASAVPAAIAGTGAQTLVVNDAGTVLGFGALNLGSAAAVTGVLPGGNYSAVNLAASGAGGVQGILGTANMTAVNVGSTGGGGIQGQPFFQPATALPVAGSSTVGIKISSASLLGIYVGTGIPTFPAGTGSIYLNGAPTTATSRLFINTNGSTSWATFTASL